MRSDREPTVVSSVREAQIPQLQSDPGQAGLCIRLLGPVSVTCGGQTVAISSKKARALLGYLALREGTAISRGALTGLLWGDRSEGQARASLRQALSELRAVLSVSEPVPIAASKETVTWAAGSAWVDANVLSAAAKSTNSDVLRRATELIGGELMEGFSLEEPGFRGLAADRAGAIPATRLRHLCAIDGAGRTKRKIGGGAGFRAQACIPRFIAGACSPLVDAHLCGAGTLRRRAGAV